MSFQGWGFSKNLADYQSVTPVKYHTALFSGDSPKPSLVFPPLSCLDFNPQAGIQDMHMNSCLTLPSPLSSFLLPSGKNHPNSKELSFTQHDSAASATRALWTPCVWQSVGKKSSHYNGCAIWHWPAGQGRAALLSRSRWNTCELKWSSCTPRGKPLP